MAEKRAGSAKKAQEKKPNILIIDDDKAIREALFRVLKDEGFEVSMLDSGLKALDTIKSGNFDLVLCDVKMPHMDGIEVLESVLEEVYVPFIMISGHGTISTAVECMKKGAVEFIEKPFGTSVIGSIRGVLADNTPSSATFSGRARLKSMPKERSEILKESGVDFVGKSQAIQDIFDSIQKFSHAPARVLITGENGTGKEVVAKLIHAMGPSSRKAMVEVNCAAIPSELIESELFGHEKGAFTSADKQRKGKFELADGSSLFLDEIGDMSLSAQAKVLRALEEKKISRVGSEKTIDVFVRVIAATNKNLAEEIAEGRFREDLYYRLNVVRIHIPPLRERKEDIPLLIEHFIRKVSKQYDYTDRSISKDAIKLLTEMEWRGNVRELNNVVERLLLLTNGEITADDVRKHTIK